MAGTSVTGKGLGAGTKHSRGEDNQWQLDRKAPVIVAAGSVALVGGAATVTFPEVLPDSKSEYIVVLQSRTANRAYSTTRNDSDSKFASFVIAGTGTDTVDWVVIKSGWRLDI